MKTTWRVLLVTLAFAAFFVPTASAQIECYECDPWGPCYEECWYCWPPHPDYCPQNNVHYTTCGDRTGACMQDNCTPDWEETGRVAVGTYGQAIDYWNCAFFEDCECEHHTVYRVTEEDQNQCNMSSYYWEREFCDNVIDGEKHGHDQPDCCDGYGPTGAPDSLYTCNDWHSCF